LRTARQQSKTTQSKTTHKAKLHTETPTSPNHGFVCLFVCLGSKPPGSGHTRRILSPMTRFINSCRVMGPGKAFFNLNKSVRSSRTEPLFTRRAVAECVRGGGLRANLHILQPIHRCHAQRVRTAQILTPSCPHLPPPPPRCASPQAPL